MNVLVVHMIVAERVVKDVVAVARMHVKIYVLAAQAVVVDARAAQAAQVAQLLVGQYVRLLVDHAQDAKIIVDIHVASAAQVAQGLVILIVMGVQGA